MAILRFAWLLSFLPLDVSETITGYIYCDNYFEFYFNGVKIAVDKLEFTPHNAVKVSFEYDGSSDKIYAILCQDWASATGYEYTASGFPSLGDGALLAEFSDGTRTTSAWKAYVVSFGPTDESISNGCSQHNLSPCAIETQAIPSNWYEMDYDDSSWASATQHTEGRTGWGHTPRYSGGQCGDVTSPITKRKLNPSTIATTEDECLDPRKVLCGGDERCDGSEGRFIWGADLDRDNRILFRFNASDTDVNDDGSDTYANDTIRPHDGSDPMKLPSDDGSDPMKPPSDDGSDPMKPPFDDGSDPMGPPRNNGSDHMGPPRNNGSDLMGPPRNNGSDPMRPPFLRGPR